MSDSRYGIVEKLTQEKLNLLREKSELDADIDQCDFTIADHVSMLDRDIERLRQEEIDLRNRVEKRVVNARNKKESLIANKTKQLEGIEERLLAIDDGLKKLMEISSLQSQSSEKK